jgi:hypothetical protein
VEAVFTRGCSLTFVLEVTRKFWMEDRYLQLVGFVQNAMSETAKLANAIDSRRVKKRRLRDVLRYSEARAYVRDKRVLSTISPRPTPEQRAWGAEFSTDEERGTLAYRLLTSEFRDEQLAEEVRQRYSVSSAEVKALEAIHEAKKERTGQLSLPRVLGIVLAASALVIKVLPKEFFRQFGWHYANVVFWETIVTLGILGYLTLIFLPYWWRLYRDMQAYRRFGRVLVYLRLLTEDSRGRSLDG